jgi:hypothetical protein
MTNEGKDLIESISYAPMDTTDRTIENLYKILMNNDVEQFKDATYFSNFFHEFMYLIDKEKKNIKI